METAGTKIYTDTNALRYFGDAFRASSLDDDLRDHLLMSPVSILELLSQLATRGGKDALSAVQAIVNVYNPSHTGLLPWSEDAFREAVFGVPAKPDTFTDAATGAVNDCLAATTARELHKQSTRLRGLLDEAKHETTAAFADLLKACKSDGPMPDDTHRSIFAHAIAERAEVSTGEVDVDKVIDRLDALYVYEVDKLKAAIGSHNYNVKKHENDFFDAEQLVYLAYPGLNFLTCDTGFNRAAASPQFARIHIVSPEFLMDHATASALIRNILAS
jgi:hypothetical protein